MDFDAIVVYVIGLTSLFLVGRILQNPRGLRGSVLTAYIIRLVTLFFDILGKHLYALPHSGGDTEGFFSAATRISMFPSLLSENIYGGFYSKLLGTLYLLTDANRLLGQYLNVLFGMSIIFILLKIMNEIEIKDKLKKITILIACFFPHSIIFSSILLRESVITMLVSGSLYFMIRWIRKGNINNFGVATALVLLASGFHAGVIGILAGYAFMFMFYNRGQNKLIFKATTVFSFSIMVLLFMVIYLQFGELLLGKFQSVEDMSDIYRRASGGRGGSVYLSGLKINSFGQLLIYSPIKMLYFLTVPLPQHWRGLNDLISFFFDGIMYLYFAIFTLKNRKHISKDPIAIGLIVMILGSVFIFGVGISNAGTALRHRHKILPIFLTLFALTKSIHQNNISKNSRKQANEAN